MPLKKKKSKPVYAGTRHPAVATVACPFCHEPAGGPCKRRAAYNPTRTFFPTHQARVAKYEDLKRAVVEAHAKEAARKKGMDLQPGGAGVVEVPAVAHGAGAGALSGQGGPTPSPKVHDGIEPSARSNSPMGAGSGIE